VLVVPLDERMGDYKYRLSPMMIMLQGPVSNAARGGSINPWFSIGVGVFVLVTLWIKYLRTQKETKAPLGILFGITAICLVFIVTGVWELFR
jgi:hypothetical protein